MSNLVFAIFLSGILLEFVLSLMWVPVYFRIGIPIFHMRVKVKEGFDFSGAFSGENQAEAPLENIGLSAKQISANEVAIRERLFIISRSATLHGLIRFSGDRNEVIAWGFVNWSLLFFLGIVFLMLSGLRDVPVLVWPMVLLIILGTSTGKIMKLRKFVRAITEQNRPQVGPKQA